MAIRNRDNAAKQMADHIADLRARGDTALADLLADQARKAHNATRNARNSEIEQIDPWEACEDKLFAKCDPANPLSYFPHAVTCSTQDNGPGGKGETTVQYGYYLHGIMSVISGKMTEQECAIKFEAKADHRLNMAHSYMARSLNRLRFDQLVKLHGRVKADQLAQSIRWIPTRRWDHIAELEASIGPEADTNGASTMDEVLS